MEPTNQPIISGISGQIILPFKNLKINDISLNLCREERECKPKFKASFKVEQSIPNLYDKYRKNKIAHYLNDLYDRVEMDSI